MDELTDAIGQLSTSAKEWKPSSQRSTPAPQSPVPNSMGSPQRGPSTMHIARSAGKAGVKEFAPGTGWQSGGGGMDAQAGRWEPSSSLSTGHHPPESTRLPSVSTVPAGPSVPPPIRSLHSMGLSDELWRYHRDMALESLQEMDPADPRHKAVPPPFSNAYQLDQTSLRNSRSSFGYPTLVFKVVNREDGRLYCLRRVDSVRSVSHKIAASVTDRWVAAIASDTHMPLLDHPGLVRFYRVFLFNRAVFFLHEYIPGARTLRERFFQNNTGGAALPEPMIWSCVTQLVAAIRAVHGASLACRTLQANHILCEMSAGGRWGESSFHMRFHVNCLAMVDALEFESRKAIRDLQHEDMQDLGRLILSMATGAEISRSSDDGTLRRCDAFMRQNCSPALYNLALSLVSPNVKTPVIIDVSRAIADHAFDELTVTQMHCVKYESALASEYESGRGLRLLLKLGFINERPELGVDRRWTESGDCYILKLFRDYVFHQADGAGNPVMDLGHVVTSLNKLDALDEEKIVLSSRDGKTLMIVTFADVARCLDNAYGELCSKAVPPSALQY